MSAWNYCRPTVLWNSQIFKKETTCFGAFFISKCLLKLACWPQTICGIHSKGNVESLHKITLNNPCSVCVCKRLGEKPYFLNIHSKPLIWRPAKREKKRVFPPANNRSPTHSAPSNPHQVLANSSLIELQTTGLYPLILIAQFPESGISPLPANRNNLRLATAAVVASPQASFLPGPPFSPSPPRTPPALPAPGSGCPESICQHIHPQIGEREGRDGCERWQMRESERSSQRALMRHPSLKNDSFLAEIINGNFYQ